MLGFLVGVPVAWMLFLLLLSRLEQLIEESDSHTSKIPAGTDIAFAGNPASSLTPVPLQAVASIQPPERVS